MTQPLRNSGLGRNDLRVDAITLVSPDSTALSDPSQGWGVMEAPTITEEVAGNQRQQHHQAKLVKMRHSVVCVGVGECCGAKC